MSTEVKSKQKKTELEEFRELFEQMCVECGSDMRRLLIKHKVILD